MIKKLVVYSLFSFVAITSIAWVAPVSAGCCSEGDPVSHPIIHPAVTASVSPEKPKNISAQSYQFHTLGPDNAYVTIEVFGGLQEVFTHQLIPTLKALMVFYPEKIRVVWHYYPLDFLTEEYWAGNAAECAADQGKFWEYQADLLLHNSNEFGPILYHHSAYEVGIDMKAFNSCVKLKRNMRRVEYDRQLGDKMGVFGVPTSFVNGEKVLGAKPFVEFESIVSKYIQK